MRENTVKRKKGVFGPAFHGPYIQTDFIVKRNEECKSHCTCTHFQSSTLFLQRLFRTHRSAQTPNCAMAQPCGQQMRYWASVLPHHGANLSPVSPLPRNRATAQWRKPVASRPATALWSQLVASTMEQTCGQ